MGFDLDSIGKKVTGAISKATGGGGLSGVLSKATDGIMSKVSGGWAELVSGAISKFTDAPLVKLGKAIFDGDMSGALKAGIDMLASANIGASLMPMFSRVMEFMNIPSAFFSENVLGNIQAFAAKAENSGDLQKMAETVSEYWQGSADAFKQVQQFNIAQLFAQAQARQLLG
jgi:hypothetical protein